MNNLIIWFITIVSFCLGYYLGGDKKISIHGVDKMWKSTKDKFKDRPKPGVVNHLTEEQIAEKHDPVKKGNLEAFNRLFREHPELLPEDYKNG